MFTVRGDPVGAVYGWYLDDIELYTCDLPRISNLAAPRIVTSVRYPATLAATSDRWSPAAVRKAYQWLRNGAAIPGATGATYRLVAADVGRRLSVRVTASATGYVARAATSNATAAVLPGRLVGATPKIRGTARVGKVLKVSRGSWGSGVRLRQRWYRNSKAIRGATGTSYRLTRKDLRKRISVKVTGTKAGYAATTRASRPTAKVRPRP
ncbi:hypothetical protein [Mumia sp. DW29H23]|uniref:hypothetical protein n=1 Tax=Mumia sp. DW29H23 TaxID=3421241 RepID=UPI003D686461